MDQTGNGKDEPLTIINQAAMWVWYGNLNPDKWRILIVLLYKLVNDLGRKLTERTTLH